MNFPKQITSNRRRCQYILNRTALIDNTSAYVLLRRDLTTSTLGTEVPVYYGRGIYKYWFTLSDGIVTIGCRRFNKATSNILREWAGIQ